MEPSANRQAKNSVFIDLFGQPEYQLQMLHVFHPEMTAVKPSDIQTITIKQVVTNHQYNDLAFMVKDIMMVFVEAQSTWSANIALRILLYLADTIQGYILQNHMDIHDTHRLRLPKPEFYVIYTGKRKVGQTLSLRDDFFGDSKVPLDLITRVFTAETDDIVGQYIIFCHIFDQQIQKHGPTREAVSRAIELCMDRGVLKEYLQTREQEVVDIMITLFDQRVATEAYANSKALRAEKRAFTRGHAEGRAEGAIITLNNLVSEGLLSKELAAAQAGLTVEQFEEASRNLDVDG